MKQVLLAVVGAVVGGALGYFAVGWLRDQGLYGMVLPGGLLGFGAGLAGTRSIAVASGCAIAAIGLGLFTEWSYFPFNADPGFGYFLAHVADLTPVTLLMIGLGAAIAFWVPYRRSAG